jgi:hypothetical protein
MVPDLAGLVRELAGAPIDARLLRDPSREIDPEIRGELHRGRNLAVTGPVDNS